MTTKKTSGKQAKENKQAKAKPKDRILFDLDSLRFYKTKKQENGDYERDFSIHKTEIKKRYAKSLEWRETPETKLIKLLLKAKPIESKQILLKTFPWLSVPLSKDRTLKNLDELLMTTIKELDSIGETSVAMVIKQKYEELEWLNYTPKDKRSKQQRSIQAFLNRGRSQGTIKIPKGGDKGQQILVEEWIKEDKNNN